MTYAEAVRQIVAEYKRRQADYEQAELDCLAADAAFFESERKLRALRLDKALGKKTDKAELQAAEKENAAHRARLGLTPPKPRCPLCGDTGRTGGNYCDCAVKRAVAASGGEIGIPLHRFEDVKYAVYGEMQDTYRKVFGNVDTICSTYPQNKRRCIVLSGGTGNGKTYLAGCAAQRVLERGLSVLALTAFAFFDRCRKYHTSFGDDKYDYLDPLLDCSLLVIDDLGTESILKNITVEYLYQIVNERNTAGKLTLVTTNLTPDGLLARYGERIYSRMFDKSLSYGVYLKGADIRKAL